MAKVIAGFRDKLTDAICPTGSDYNGERIEELTKAGLLKKEAKTKSKKVEQRCSWMVLKKQF